MKRKAAPPLQKKAAYEDLYNLPENMVGEIIDGELIAAPRSSRKHTTTVSSLGFKLGPPYQFGEGGGPGGWIILVEPEIGLGSDILVPDLAGWKRERFPVSEPHNWISTAPDWVCEVLSPGTARLDRITKMRAFARHAVPYVWLLDPVLLTLEVFKLESGRWVLLDLLEKDDKVRTEPFQEVEIDLGALWLVEPPQPTNQ